MTKDGGELNEMTHETWGQVCADLAKTLGETNFAAWIEPLRFEALEDGVARFEAPTTFIRSWVARNYADHIRHHISKHGETVDRIELSVTPHRTAAARTEERPAVTSAQPGTAPAASTLKVNGHADLPGAPLDRRYTFDAFVVGKPNQLAHAAARRVAEGARVTFNPLFLYGGVGLGKTHLMHAIAWRLHEVRPELNVVYLSAEQFMYRFVQAIRENGMMQFKEIFRAVDVLMVDDVQFIAGKDGTQEEFFHTFNALVDQNKQIIISADRAPVEIKKLENRIASRLQSGLVVDLHPTDYELRLGILQQKRDFYAESYPGLVIRDAVLEFLAHRITTNVRVLEGALTKLFAFGSLVGKDVTLDMAQECLSDILRASDRKVSVEEIQRTVAEHYNMRISDMVGPKRHKTIARPRQMAMYLAKKLTARSLPEIGRRFGGRDHTTVMHAVKRVEDLKTTDTQIAEDLELLRRMLEA
jgi:chromosomal replication initiator protein